MNFKFKILNTETVMRSVVYTFNIRCRCWSVNVYHNLKTTVNERYACIFIMLSMFAYFTVQTINKNIIVIRRLSIHHHDHCCSRYSDHKGTVSTFVYIK